MGRDLCADCGKGALVDEYVTPKYTTVEWYERSEAESKQPRSPMPKSWITVVYLDVTLSASAFWQARPTRHIIRDACAGCTSEAHGS